MEEFDEAKEIMFVFKGKIAIGFHYNKEKHFVTVKKDYCIIGAYSMLFDERS